MSRIKALVVAGVAIALGIYCALQLRVGTDLMHFMPDGERTELAEVSSRLADSRFTRTMVLSVAAPQTERAMAAARELADALRDDPEVAWVRSGVDETQFEDLFGLYFPRRFYFLSVDPERELPERLSESALRADARRLRGQLASPVSALLSRIAPEDPLSSFRAIAERFRQGESTLEMRDGQLITPDGRFAIVLLGTRSSAFESGPQALLLERIAERFAGIRERGGRDLVLEMSGANRYAVAAEQDIKGDVYRIGTASFLGVAALFLIVVASLRGFLIVAVPPLAGILVATSVALLREGRIDGITMVFGASLMGIAIDYSVHLLIHHHLTRSGETPAATARRIRPSLVLGAATTVASFGGLAVTAFPAFREMSFFAGIGVATALLATLYVLPDLVGWVPPLPARSRASADWLAARFESLERLPRRVVWIPVALLPLAIWGAMQLEWTDDMSELTRFDPELVDEDRRVRARAAGLESAQFAIAVADSAPAVLAVNDRVQVRLREAIAAGELEGARSVQGLVWSESLQRRNWELVKNDSGLYDRLDAAFTAEGFRPGAFRAFGAALGAEPVAPLTLADLEASPLADFLAPFVVPLGDRIAAVTYLHGLAAPDAVHARLAGLDGVYVLEQKSFVNDVYREFRESTLEQIGVGALLVTAMLILRYRSWRRALAAFLPSVTVALLLLAAFGLSGVRANLLHAMSLVMVMGMGVDYGVFLVDSAGKREELGATLLSLLMSCLTTVFVFGTLAISSQPSLRAIGLTTGAGIALSYLFAPIALAAFGLTRDRQEGA